MICDLKTKVKNPYLLRSLHHCQCHNSFSNKCSYAKDFDLYDVSDFVPVVY